MAIHDSRFRALTHLMAYMIEEGWYHYEDSIELQAPGGLTGRLNAAATLAVRTCGETVALSAAGDVALHDSSLHAASNPYSNTDTNDDSEESSSRRHMTTRDCIRDMFNSRFTPAKLASVIDAVDRAKLAALMKLMLEIARTSDDTANPGMEQFSAVCFEEHVQILQKLLRELEVGTRGYPAAFMYIVLSTLPEHRKCLETARTLLDELIHQEQTLGEIKDCDHGEDLNRTGYLTFLEDCKDKVGQMMASLQTVSNIISIHREECNGNACDYWDQLNPASRAIACSRVQFDVCLKKSKDSETSSPDREAWLIHWLGNGPGADVMRSITGRKHLAKLQECTTRLEALERFLALSNHPDLQRQTNIRLNILE